MADLVRGNMYQCKACDRSFSRNTKLQQHMTSHSLEENMLYGDIFTYHLTSIKREGEPSKEKIACPVCPMTYIHRGHHKKHLWTVHGLTEELFSPTNIIARERDGPRGKDVAKGNAVKTSNCLNNLEVKSETVVQVGSLNPEQANRGKKRGRPPKVRYRGESAKGDEVGGTVETVDTLGNCEVKYEEIADFGPLNPEQTMRRKKRGRPPKQRCLSHESAKDVDGKGTVKTPDSARNCAASSGKPVHFGPLNLELTNRVRKRGRPRKRRYHGVEAVENEVGGTVITPYLRNTAVKSKTKVCLEPLNLEQTQREEKRARPLKVRCLGIESNRDGLGQTDVPGNHEVMSHKIIHFGPLNSEKTNQGKKRGRPPKARCLRNENVEDVDLGGPVKIPGSFRNSLIKCEKKIHFELLHPEHKKRGKKRGSPLKGMSLKNGSGNKKYYECPECKKMMTQSSTLTAHMRIHTGERPYQCLVCSKTFTFYQCLWNHSWLHKTMKSFPCDQCPRTFRYYQCLWTHYKTHTSKKLSKDNIFRNRFATSVQQSYHKNKYFRKREGDHKNRRHFGAPLVNEMPFKCELCSKKFRLKISLISHKENCSLKTQLSLKVSRNNNEASDVVLTSGQADQDQNQKRGRGRPRKFVKPKMERRVFANSQTLKEFTREQHDTCLACKQLYKNCKCHVKGSGKRKEKISLLGLIPLTKTDHENANAHCHKSEMSDGSLAQSEGKPKKYYMNQKTAGTSLRRSERLKREVSVVSECRTCDQSFTCASRHNRPLKSYSQTKPYCCSYCSKSFRCQSWLQRHQNSVHPDTQKETSRIRKRKQPVNYHAETKPYSCSHCSMSFKFHSWLLRHQNSTHTDPQSETSHIKKRMQHLKNHAEMKPYSCSYCSKSFKSLSWLSRHHNLVHTDIRKEVTSIQKFKKTRLRNKVKEKSLERKCSCCGTIFISNDDYKKHIACVSCVCGQQFQCGYIFCFHASTCGECNVSVGEETVDQKPADSSCSSISKGNFPCQQDMGPMDQADPNTVFQYGNSKSPQMFDNYFTSKEY